MVREDRGKQVYYQANSDSPVFNELRGLIVKTAGVADFLRSALAPLADRINLAFIYGSFARGEERAISDVDVMVIGNDGFSEVVTKFTFAQDQLHREINPSVYSMEAFKHRVNTKEHFISSIMGEPRIHLIGDENELRTVV